MVASSATYVLMVATLLAVFYGVPDMGCEVCKHFSCIPFTDTFSINRHCPLGASDKRMILTFEILVNY